MVHVGCHITIPGGPNVKMKMKNTFCLLFLQSIFFFPWESTFPSFLGVI